MKTIKSKIRDKIAETKSRVRGKIKGKAKTAAVALTLLILVGCATSEPASRVTQAEYGDIVVRLDGASNNTVRITIGDGAMSSSDSTGSTETTTANPTNTTDIKPDINYLKSSDSTGSAADGALDSAVKKFTSWLLSDSANAPGKCTTGTCSTGTCTDGSCSGGSCSTCSDGGSCSTCSD